MVESDADDEAQSGRRERLSLAPAAADLHAHALADCRTLVQEQGSLAHHRTAHASTNLRGVHMEFRERAAEGVAMHSQLGRSLALVALVVCQHFKNIALLELPYCVGIRNAGSVHLGDQGVP